MSELITQTARLVPYAKRPKQSGGFVTAYMYEPMADDVGFKLGSFYVVLEVLVSGRASEEVTDLIIETIGEYYFNRPIIEDQTLADRFEAAVKAANTELGEHVNRGNAAWIGKLSAVIAIQAGAELHIAHTGSGEAFLYRGHSVTRITDSAPNRPSTPTKTFGSIATGQLEVGDHILLATPALVHQVSLPRLKSIVSGSSPNTSIAEITDLLRGTATDRIACLVIEITTPELAALRVRSQAPSEIHLGAAETPLETAKQAATPIAESTARSGKKLARVALGVMISLRYHTRRISLAAVDYIRQSLTTKAGRKIALLSALVIMAVLLTFGFAGIAASHQAGLVRNYQKAYQTFQYAQQQLANGDKTGAQNTGSEVHTQLNALKKSENSLNQGLAHDHDLHASEPTTLSAFQIELNTFMNELSGLTVEKPTTITNLTSSINTSSRLEIFNGKAYIFKAGTLEIVPLAGGLTIKSKADLSAVGMVTYTTLSSDGSGIYVLSNQPGVWFYRFNNDNLIPVSTASGQWASGTALASYLTNLYLLSNDVVYKYAKTSNGFGAPSKSLSINTQSNAASSLSVDGSIYVGSTSQILRYISGKLLSTTVLPVGFGTPVDLRSASNGSLVLATSTGSGHMAVWSVGTNQLTLVEQVQLEGVSKLYDATYDAQTDTYYATADQRLVSFKLVQ